MSHILSHVDARVLESGAMRPHDRSVPVFPRVRQNMRLSLAHVGHRSPSSRTAHPRVSMSLHSFEGAACEKRACPNRCSGHGRCLPMRELSQSSEVGPWVLPRLWDMRRTSGALASLLSSSFHFSSLFGTSQRSTIAYPSHRLFRSSTARWSTGPCKTQQLGPGITRSRRAACVTRGQAQPSLPGCPVRKRCCAKSWAGMPAVGRSAWAPARCKNPSGSARTAPYA